MERGDVQGSTTLRRQVPLEEIPLYLRENSLSSLGPERNHVGERPIDPLTVEAFVTTQAEFALDPMIGFGTTLSPAGGQGYFRGQ